MRHATAALAFLALATSAAAAAPPRTMDEILAAAPASAWRTPDPDRLLVMTLDSGRVVIELSPEHAPEHVANLAENPHPRAFAQRRLLVRIKAEEAQRDLATVVAGAHDHLPARLELDLVVQHPQFELHRLAGKGAGQFGDARFVLVAQRQMHQQLGLRMETELGQLFLQRIGGADRRQRHPTISRGTSPRRPRPARRAAAP